MTGFYTVAMILLMSLPPNEYTITGDGFFESATTPESLHVCDEETEIQLCANVDTSTVCPGTGNYVENMFWIAGPIGNMAQTDYVDLCIQVGPITEPMQWRLCVDCALPGPMIETQILNIYPDLPDPLCGTLPVEYMYFEAVEKDGKPLLRWATASEVNNSHFEVQRSTDGERWEPLGKVNGFGTAYIVNEYRFADDQPRTGTNYYRLKQVDYDGAFEYSPVVSFEVEKTLTVYPNPSSDFVIVEGEGKPQEVILYSGIGQVIKIVSGYEYGQKISLSGLLPGLYILSVDKNYKQLSVR